MNVRLRVSEGEARALLLIHAVEDADLDGVLLPVRTRAAATQRAFDDGATDDAARLRARASLLRDDLLRTAPSLQTVLDPPRWFGLVLVLTVAVAAAVGAATNALGPERHVSVLAFPLVGILAWNLAIYAGLVIHALLGASARVRGTQVAQGRLASLGRWLAGVGLAGLARRVGGTARSAVVTDAAARFQRLWLPTAAPLIAARVGIVLHLGALALALGAVAGMYAAGVAFEFRATWESTWLDASTVQRYLDTVLAPASRVLGTPVPDVAPLRGPAGEGDARPWIHLWATTLALFVVLPRAALAGLQALRAARRSRRLSVELDDAYARRALHSGRGAATVLDVVYYSCAPDTALRERLHALLQEHAGARAVVRDTLRLEYGADAERVEPPAPTAGSGVVVLVFTLAQTPEPEVHGEFVHRLQKRLDGTGADLIVVLETATYRARVGSEDRVRERRATWERLLRDLRLTALELV